MSEISGKHQLVTDNQQLKLLCARWHSSDYLTLDTEFIRVNTFYPLPGLIQLGAGEEIYLIDPLQIDEWDEFIALMSDTGIVKIIHSGSEDLILFLDFFKCLPASLFDTQKAAAFLGYGASISYLNLVRELTGIELAKGETRSDWLQRPLTSQQLDYAALDVAYLPLIYRELRQQLDKRGRLQIVLAECEKMRQIALATEDESNWIDLYLQMGAAWRLNETQLGALQPLCVWREQQARIRNKPRTWIARDSDLIQLAEAMPGSAGELRQIKDMSRNLYQQDTQIILSLIADSKPVDSAILQSLESQPLTRDQRLLLKKLQQAVRHIAHDTGIAEELLARKKVLIQFLRLNEQDLSAVLPLKWPAGTEQWRIDLLQESLRAVLEKNLHV